MIHTNFHESFPFLFYLFGSPCSWYELSLCNKLYEYNIYVIANSAYEEMAKNADSKSAIKRYKFLFVVRGFCFFGIQVSAQLATKTIF